MSKFNNIRKKIRRRNKSLHIIYLVIFSISVLTVGYILGKKYEKKKRTDLQVLGSIYKRDTDVLKETVRMLNKKLVYLDSIPVGNPVLNKYKVNSEFGWRNHPIGFHYGIDLDANLNDLIISSADGLITKAEWNSSYGYYVKIKHMLGFETLYAHLNKILVRQGDLVEKGDTLGLAGTTGNSSGVHLHYEIVNAQKQINPKMYVEEDFQ